MIEIAGVGTETTATLGANNVLTLSGDGQTATLHLDRNANFSGGEFSLSSDGQGGTNVQFISQTTLRSARGERTTCKPPLRRSA